MELVSSEVAALRNMETLEGNTENKYIEPYSDMQFDIIKEETVLKTDTEDDIKGNIMDGNREAEPSKEGEMHNSEPEKFSMNKDVNCDKRLYDLEIDVKQKIEKLNLPEIVKAENVDENHSDLSTIYNFTEANVEQFHIKTEEIHIKSEDDVMGYDYEEVDSKEASQNIQSCQLCTFSTSSEKLYASHLLIHNNKQDCKLFSCTHCPYKAKRMATVREHLLKHKDISEVATFDCAHCLYKTKYKGALKSHLLTHKTLSEIVTFNCTICSYKGKQKVLLNRHLLKHKDESEIVTFDCDQCPYKAKRRKDLICHLLKHKDKSEIVTFNCTHCPYKAKAKGALTHHLLIHKDKSEIVMFSCNHCPYKAKWKASLKRHLLKHILTSQK